MFTQIGNTSVGGGYVYQWWLSAMIYYLLIEKKEIHLKGESDFNNKTKGLLKHLGGSIGPYKIERENIYLEGNDSSFEDINFLRKYTGGVWYGFIQSKSTRDDIYTNREKIYKIIKRFYFNEHFQDQMKCGFVIASNVAINASHKKEIQDNSLTFKLGLIQDVILGKTIYNKLDSLTLIKAIEDGDDSIIEIILGKIGECDLLTFKDIFEKISIILTSIYFFDSISPKNIIDSFEAINKKSKKEKIFFHTIYKATRKKKIDLSDDDHLLYDEYSDTKFGKNLETGIIEGGFLLLDS